MVVRICIESSIIHSMLKVVCNACSKWDCTGPAVGSSRLEIAVLHRRVPGNTACLYIRLTVVCKFAKENLECGCCPNTQVQEQIVEELVLQVIVLFELEATTNI